MELNLVHFKQKKNILLEENIKSSAVVFALFKTENSYSIILNKRSPFLSSHPGQISFPGGKKDKNDKDLLSTALREWEEEMGESSKKLKYLAGLDDLYTGTGFLISPYLFLYEGEFHFKLNRDEVESYFLLELDILNQINFYELKVPSSLKDKRNKIRYFDLGSDLLWGATCEIIYRFLLSNSDFNRKPILVLSNMNEPPFFNPRLEIKVVEY